MQRKKILVFFYYYNIDIAQIILSSWKTRTCFSHKLNNMAADDLVAWYLPGHQVISSHVIISPVSEGSGDVMVLRRSRPPPAARRPQWC